jgi:hypothetical protein
MHHCWGHWANRFADSWCTGRKLIIDGHYKILHHTVQAGPGNQLPTIIHRDTDTHTLKYTSYKHTLTQLHSHTETRTHTHSQSHRHIQRHRHRHTHAHTNTNTNTNTGHRTQNTEHKHKHKHKHKQTHKHKHAHARTQKHSHTSIRTTSINAVCKTIDRYLHSASTSAARVSAIGI